MLMIGTRCSNLKKEKPESYSILGIDIGTTGCKCVAFDHEFNVLVAASREYPLIHTDKGVEQDPKVWWTAVSETIKQVAKNTENIKGIGVSSQGITFVPVDAEGTPLMNAMTWLDKRAGIECNDLVDSLGAKKIYSLTGKRPNAVYTLPKLIWLKKYKPEIFNRTYKFLMTHDYIVNKLCGAFLTESSLAAGSMAYDIKNMTWSSEILDAAGIPVEKLPDTVASGTKAGNLTPEAAELLGLNTNVIVSTGGQDQKCAAYGADLTKDGVTVSLGTSAAITALYNKPVFTDDMCLPCFPYIDGKSWVLEGFSSTAGASVKWLQNNLAPEKTYKEIDNLIATAYVNGPASGNVKFFPYLGGTGSPEWYDSDGGGFMDINLDTSFVQMASAVLESTAINIRANIEIMELMGNNFTEITVFGGGANSDIWLHIIADVTNKIVRVPGMEETACLGAAMKVAEAMGYSTTTRVAEGKTIYPDNDKNVLFDEKYYKYKVMEKKIFGG